MMKGHQVTIEISMYPLTTEYEEHIIPFIQQLKQRDGILVKTNAMSTYVQGDFEEVWMVLGKAMSEAFSKGITMSNVLKIIPRKLPLDNTWLAF